MIERRKKISSKGRKAKGGMRGKDKAKKGREGGERQGIGRKK